MSGIISTRVQQASDRVTWTACRLPDREHALTDSKGERVSQISDDGDAPSVEDCTFDHSPIDPALLAIETSGGPRSWRNWRLRQAGAPVLDTYESTLCTDAWLVGGPATPAMGPYTLHNTFAGYARRSSGIEPRVVLRVDRHLSHQVRIQDPSKKLKDAWLGLDIDDEIAVLVGLVLGVRLRSMGMTRRFGGPDPKGTPAAWGAVMPSWTPAQDPSLPHLREGALTLDDLNGYLAILPTLQAEQATALVRAAKQYQLALWVVDDDPELGWLELISAVEVAASSWDTSRTDPVDALRHSDSHLADQLLSAGGDDLLALVASRLAPVTGSTAKFRRFMTAFDPGPPPARPIESIQVDWAALHRTLSKLYDYRSRRLHGGIPFPEPLISRRVMRFDDNLPAERPLKTVWGSLDTSWSESDLPMHLWIFERMTRLALLRWWRQSLGGSGEPLPSW